MSNRCVVEQFQQWRQTESALVLATVVHTAGSTYSKAGQQILIRSDGRHAGLVSGGCLESDLAEHAREVLQSGVPRLITYDMRNEADDLWGIGLGCNGLMKILLQRLTAEDNWQPFDRLATAMAGPDVEIAALVTASNSTTTPAGSLYVTRNRLAGNSLPVPAPLFAGTEFPTEQECDLADGSCSVLLWKIRPWPRLLILGAGPDALPAVRIARSMGWEVTVADHRAHYFAANDFRDADAIAVVDADKMADRIELSDFSAVVVMSHHLETDRHYLRQLATQDHSYTGILGPAARKEKLLTELNLADSDFARRLSGPVGLDIGADGPETIALALIAEIQSELARLG